MPETTTQVIVHSQPVDIEVQRAKDGTYYWTIKVHGATVADTLAMIDDADRQLRERYIKASPPPAGS